MWEVRPSPVLMDVGCSLVITGRAGKLLQQVGPALPPAATQPATALQSSYLTQPLSPTSEISVVQRLCAEYGQPTEYLEPHPPICCARPQFRRVPRLQPGEDILRLHLVLHRHRLHRGCGSPPHHLQLRPRVLLQVSLDSLVVESNCYDDLLSGSTGTLASRATDLSCRSLFSPRRTRLPSTSRMFTYWPFISLIVAAVMVTILLVLKFSEKLCRARLRSPHRHGGHPDQHPVSLMMVP